MFCCLFASLLIFVYMSHLCVFIFLRAAYFYILLKKSILVLKEENILITFKIS